MDLALFDFDGTITRTDAFAGSDSFSQFVRFAVRPSRLVVGSLLLAPVVLAYRLRWLSATRARRAVVWVGFWAESASRVSQLGERFATQVLPTTLWPQAMERIRWHQARGDDVVVVSAALDVYLRPWCKSLGVQCGTELEQRNGLLTGQYRDGDCTGEEKARRTVERFPVERYSLIYAYGDTAEDREMIDLAHRKYFRWRQIESWDETAASLGPASAAQHASGAGGRLRAGG
jgi:HAD superfamily hydrolase (TIGR01490 family)